MKNLKIENAHLRLQLTGLGQEKRRLELTIARLASEKADLELAAFRLLRCASRILSDEELADFEKALNVRPEASK